MHKETREEHDPVCGCDRCCTEAWQEQVLHRLDRLVSAIDSLAEDIRMLERRSR